MRRPLSVAAGAIAAALLAPALAHAQSAADEHLKAMIGKKAAAKAKAKPPPAAQLSSGKEDDTDAPAPPTSAQLAADTDAALLRAIVFAFEPAPREIRVIAVEDLAFLDDPRALNPLAHLALDPDPAIAQAAIRSIGHIQHPRAEEILENVVRHPTLPVNLKIMAVEELPLQATASAHELLNQLSRSTAAAPPVRQAAQNALALMTVPAAPATSPAASTPPATSSAGAGATPAATSTPADAPPLVPPSSGSPGSQR